MVMSTNTDTGIENNVAAQRRLEFEMDAENEEVGVDTISKRHSVISSKKIPHIGMDFDTDEEAYNFYNEYAKATGFSIRRQVAHKDSRGNILDRIICCSAAGKREKDKRNVNVRSHRPETRKGCPAMIKINARHTGKLRIERFIAEHKGHSLASPEKSHFLRSHRNMTTAQALQVDAMDSSGIAPKAGFEFMAKQMGGRGNIGFIFEDYNNYLRSKRTIQMETCDTRGVLEYLQQRQSEDRSFFYAIQADEDDLITNIFWSDAQMMADFTYFGDVVSFDTTYKKLRDSRPFAMFVGVNHHKQTIVFGAALLFDETSDTFCWLFDIFAKAMSGKKPQTILTDQDAAMAKALSLTWPETYHRLCIWHIYQNAAKNLKEVYVSFTDFSKDFNSCIFDYEDEDDFLSAWRRMLEKYGLQTNDWLERLFKIKEKWALVYGRQTFCGDMISTQRSESMNSALKKYVSSKMNMFRFFEHFQRLIDDRRYQELKADLWSTQSTHVLPFRVEILKHALGVYTHEVFELFQNELSNAFDSTMELCSTNGDFLEFKITPYLKNRHYATTYNLSTGEVNCSCKKFEFAGILCSHTLKLLTSRNIVRIPELYIKKRWTKKAKQGFGEKELFVPCNIAEPTNEMDDKKMIGERYKDLSQLLNQLATRASLTSLAYEIARNDVLESLKKVDESIEKETTFKLQLGTKSRAKENVVSKVVGKQVASDNPKVTSDEVIIRGLKEKNVVKSGKRLKSCLEKGTRRKKQKDNTMTPSTDSIALHGSKEKSSQVQNLNKEGYGLDFSAPAIPNSLSYISQESFLSQVSQEHEVGMRRSSLYDPTQGLSRLQGQFNISPFHLGNDQHTHSSLTQLLQEQIRQKK